MYRVVPRIASQLRVHAVPATRRYATKGAVPPPPPKLSFTERLRNKLWRPGAVPTQQSETEQLADSTSAVRKPTDIPGYEEALDARDLPIAGLNPAPGECDIPLFIKNMKFQNRTSVVRAVHRAVVEVYTPMLNGQSVADFTIRYTGPEHLTETVNIQVSHNGQAVFDFRSPDVEQGILSTLLEESEVRPYTEEEVYPSSENYPEWVSEGLERKGWTALELKEGAKFAIVKRVTQLTGIKVQDEEATKMNTVARLLEHLETKPKPQKLYEVISESPLPNLPNVKVYETRLRPWDKEKMIGRERPFEKAVGFKYPFEERDRK